LGARRIEHQTQIADVIAWTAAPVEPAWVSVESDPDGWWYAASAPNGWQVVAQFRDPGTMRDASGRRIDLHDAIAATHLMRNAVVLPARGALIQSATVNAGSATLGFAAGEGWLAVGDAAAAFDPISSQGLSNAITSAQAGAQAARRRIDGETSAFDEYAARLAATYALYLRGLGAHYRSELRWRERPFWRRRHALSSGIEDVGEERPAQP
jgi:2-polyprenyl-6-methoxyphenol hydroxylase-like FAD-dependent oxidoreductase